MFSFHSDDCIHLSWPVMHLKVKFDWMCSIIAGFAVCHTQFQRVFRLHRHIEREIFSETSNKNASIVATICFPFHVHRPHICHVISIDGETRPEPSTLLIPSSWCVFTLRYTWALVHIFHPYGIHRVPNTVFDEYTHRSASASASAQVLASNVLPIPISNNNIKYQN